MRRLVLALVCVALTPALASALPPSPVRPVTTYSIVARDADTGELGVAVQSHWFSVGQLVPWAQAGVGAVATQSMVDPSYGPHGLELMAGGAAAASALSTLLERDEGRELRQVAMVDAGGGAANFTGARCIAEAGGRTGAGYAVQANLMANPTVPDAMARAYEQATGPLAERLLAALAAAEREGGDIRGRQSAALLVVPAEATGNAWEDVSIELRVEDHATPVAELERLLRLHRGYEQMNAGDLAVEHGDIAAANRAYGAAAAILGGNLEARYWHAIALAGAGRLDEALPLFAAVFAAGENWRELTPRLVPGGFLPVDDETLELIMRQGR
ncbi:MAG: DUF1028 domain-containing protein [Candidatus Krumholzibacteriia bacterium]